MTNQTMIDKDKIIKEIEEKQKNILSNLNSESIAVYIFLKNEYAKGKILDNFVFQFVFRTYYRLDNAGLSDGIKRRFFELLDQKQINLETILSELYEIPTLKGKKTVQFSFATKLLHTINSNKPIFALEISRVTNIRPTGSGEAKIHSCIERYDFLEKLYLDMLQDERITNIISEFRLTFKVGDQMMSDTKVLDFIMWSLGKLKDKNKTAYNNG